MLPKLPKILDLGGVKEPLELGRRTQDWGIGVQALLGALRSDSAALHAEITALDASATSTLAGYVTTASLTSTLAGYQLLSAKDAASGYCGLDGSAKVALSKLALSGSTSTFLRSDGTEATPAVATTSPAYVSFVSGVQDTTLTSSFECGAALFNPSIYDSTGRTVKFVAELESSVSTQTCSLELYNLTDGATVATLTTTSTVPTKCATAALSVPATLPNSEKLYSVRLRSSGGNHPVQCKMARFEVTY